MVPGGKILNHAASHFHGIAGSAQGDLAEVGIVAEDRVLLASTFRCHQHRLAQPAPDCHEDGAERVGSLLSLQLTEVNIEADLGLRVESEDREHPASGQTFSTAVSSPSGRAKTLAAVRSDCSAVPISYCHCQPPAATRSKTACQSSTVASGIKRSGRGPIKSGSKNSLTCSQRRSGMTVIIRTPSPSA